ncbi:MAG: hypothetical protein IKM97_01635 [Clostridia bacterium]|nr:hypothetical protein [Clostridia bacterium]
MVVGWYTGLSTVSAPSWLDNYHDKIASGETIATAINYANSQTYLYNNVKNTHLCYNSISALSNGDLPDNLSNVEDNNNILSSMTSKENYGKDDVENVIKSYDSSFNKDKYQKIISDGFYLTDVNTGETIKSKSYIDYVLKIGDYTTNSGYTIVLDSDDKVEAIYDNTIDGDFEKINSENNSYFSISNSDKEFYLNKARASIENSDKIKNEEISFYYDIENDKKGAYVVITLDEGKNENMIEFIYDI